MYSEELLGVVSTRSRDVGVWEQGETCLEFFFFFLGRHQGSGWNRPSGAIRRFAGGIAGPGEMMSKPVLATTALYPAPGPGR